MKCQHIFVYVEEDDVVICPKCEKMWEVIPQPIDITITTTSANTSTNTYPQDDLSREE
jgi:hypothetical protein